MPTASRCTWAGLGRRSPGVQRHPGRSSRPAQAADCTSAINIPNYKGHGGIFGDFLHCVKTRERPFRDIEIAHRTVATCHLANIVFWTGRGLKFDPVKEQVVDDEETNRWIDRPKRRPWVL